MRREWEGFILEDYPFADFTPGELVIDVGCGHGNLLERLRSKGAWAVGIDGELSRLRGSRARGADVARAAAEQLPFRSGAADGVICKVVVPYTDERKAIAEIGRVLRAQGRAMLCFHGTGYYLRYLLKDSSWRLRVYAIRTLINTAVYRLAGRRLPRLLGGSTLAQSRARLRRYYADAGLEVEHDSPSKEFAGLPVFIYQRVRKTGAG